MNYEFWRLLLSSNILGLKNSAILCSFAVIIIEHSAETFLLLDFSDGTSDFGIRDNDFIA